MKYSEFRLSGSGGQGLILAGIILAEAALQNGKNVVQSQSYGPEARGGASKAEVIISDDLIYYPKIENCDVLLALTQKAYDKYIDSLKPGGLLILDNMITRKANRNDVDVYSMPILSTAADKLNKMMVANIVALGCICELSNIVDKKYLEKAVMNRVPHGTEELNKKALIEGFKLVKDKKREMYYEVC